MASYFESITLSDLAKTEVILATAEMGDFSRWLKVSMDFNGYPPVYDVVIGRENVYSGYDINEAIAHYNEGY